MKKTHMYLVVALAAICLMTAPSCTKPENGNNDKQETEEPKDPKETETVIPAPGTPGPITKVPDVLTVDGGAEFTFSVNAVENAESYNWTIADGQAGNIWIKEGQGTPSVSVQVTDKSVVIPSGTVSVTASNKTGTSDPRIFSADITVKGEYVYKTKKYGEKEWFVENCREAGPNKDVGIAFDLTSRVIDGYTVPMMLNDAAGRYYTWYEAVSGIPGCTPEDCPIKPGSEGTDSVGKPYKMDGSESGEYNVQLQGVCPDGWHIPNANDWWDLIVAIEKEYDVASKTYADGLYSTTLGGYKCADYGKPWGKKEIYEGCTGGSIVWIGNVGQWLRGGNGRVSDGGVWRTANTSYSWSGGTFAAFINEAEKVGFDWFPCGYFGVDGIVDSTIGAYGYTWLLYQMQGKDTYANALCISCTSMNSLQTLYTARGETMKQSRHPVRCVKNY